MKLLPRLYDGRMIRAEFIDGEKGSSESGHYDHTGLPGVWGGSRPTGTAEPDVESEEQPRDSASMAKQIRSDAENSEPGMTEDILAVAEEHGAEMFQLEKRLKSASSIERRLNLLMTTRGKSLDEAADLLVDKVRYTMIFDTDTYIDKVNLVFDSLESQGWIEHPAFSENYWESGLGFEGLSYVFVKAGVAFELQFHTPQAAKILPESHRLYELARVLEPGPKYNALVKKMLALWATVPSPPGWETARGKKIGR